MSSKSLVKSAILLNYDDYNDHSIYPFTGLNIYKHVCKSHTSKEKSLDVGSLYSPSFYEVYSQPNPFRDKGEGGERGVKN